MVEQNMSADTSPTFIYSPANTSIDLFGLDPYPSNINVPNNYDLNIIPAAVSAAETAGVPLADIVPVYQTFGGGGYASWIVPTPAQEQQILSTWGASVPSPAFDYAYSWGVQSSDTALSTDPGLQTVFCRPQRRHDAAAATSGADCRHYEHERDGEQREPDSSRYG